MWQVPALQSVRALQSVSALRAVGWFLVALLLPVAGFYPVTALGLRAAHRPIGKIRWTNSRGRGDLMDGLGNRVRTWFARRPAMIRPVTFLIVPSRGLLGRSVRYDLLPLSNQ